MTLAELQKSVTEALTPKLGHSEAKATADLLLLDDLEATPTKLLLYGDRLLEPETVARFDKYVHEILCYDVPPQYITGKAHWMGLDLTVSDAVLIPRPETAILVDRIYDDYHDERDMRVLDIGTGSGCIAIALARFLPFASVKAIDISPNALAVARENAKKLMVKIDFEKIDILSRQPQGIFDIIVSNPPYITEKERPQIEPRVKDHEPGKALFVPDDDPLLFYRAILGTAKEHLAEKGTVYMEINYLYAAEVKGLFDAGGFECEIMLDDTRTPRFAIARR